MKTIKEVNQLIWEIDNHDDIEKYGIDIDGLFISFWAYIRQILNLELIALVGFNLPTDATKKISWLQKIKFIINAYRFRLQTKKAQVLFLSHSIGNVDYGDYVENIYHDLFAKTLIEAGKKVVIIEQPNKPWQGFKKRKITVDAYSLTWLHIKRRLKGLLLSPFNRTNPAEIHRFVACLEPFLKKYSPLNYFFVIEKIKKQLLSMIQNSKYTIEMWEQVIKLTEPNVVITQDICYGGSIAIASLIFKRKNIIVIEDQHGFIGAGDTKYNFSEKIKSKKQFSRFLPDYFLLHGEKWALNLNFNTQKMIIGNPYLSQVKERYGTLKQEYDVLIITDSERPEFTSKKTAVLSQENYHILFRPHPRELSSVTMRYGKLLSHTRIKLDNDRDVYRSILKSKVVICIVGSYLSTVVAEALALDRPVFCWCDDIASFGGKEMFSNHVKAYQSDDSLLTDLRILLGEPNRGSLPFTGFYASNWQTNFNELIKRIL